MLRLVVPQFQVTFWIYQASETEEFRGFFGWQDFSKPSTNRKKCVSNKTEIALSIQGCAEAFKINKSNCRIQKTGQIQENDSPTWQQCSAVITKLTEQIDRFEDIWYKKKNFCFFAINNPTRICK